MNPMFEESSFYLEEFGVDCVCDGHHFKAIKDVPDEFLEIGSIQVATRSYKLMFATKDVTLRVGQIISIGAERFKVQKPPLKRFDGVFSDVEIEVVSG